MSRCIPVTVGDLCSTIAGNLDLAQVMPSRRRLGGDAGDLHSSNTAAEPPIGSFSKQRPHWAAHLTCDTPGVLRSNYRAVDLSGK